MSAAAHVERAADGSLLALEELITQKYEQRFPRERVTRVDLLEHEQLTERLEFVLIEVRSKHDTSAGGISLLAGHVRDGEQLFFTRFSSTGELLAMARAALHVAESRRVAKRRASHRARDRAKEREEELAPDQNQG